jgi:AraC family transcriptional regulator of adaptative response/methylated-DNA-[protein]-cysteine methyltransferase
VWEKLLVVPYGETRSYQDLALAIGDPAAVRAVGRANGMNRIAILIPCHRIVNRNGDLGGYGGGLRRKQYLLNLEQAGGDRAGQAEKNGNATRMSCLDQRLSHTLTGTPRSKTNIQYESPPRSYLS